MIAMGVALQARGIAGDPAERVSTWEAIIQENTLDDRCIWQMR